MCCQFACWDCGFESRWKYGCISLESVVLCQVEVSESALIICPFECDMTECDVETSTMRRARPTRTVEPWGGEGGKNKFLSVRNKGNELLNFHFI